MDFDNENPWEGILLSIMFAIWVRVHTTTQHKQSQLVFGRDVILNWKLNKQFKHALINKGNQKENLHEQSHVHHTGDKVLLKNAWKMKFNQDAYIGPYAVTEVWNDGTVRAHRGNITNTYNLRNITTFVEYGRLPLWGSMSYVGVIHQANYFISTDDVNQCKIVICEELSHHKINNIFIFISYNIYQTTMYLHSANVR